MPRKEIEGFTMTYAMMAELCNLPLNTIHQAATRHARGHAVMPLDIFSFRSCCMYIMKHGPADWRKEGLANAAGVLIEDGECGPGKKARTYD
jgi:hypothetical protein